MVAEGRVSTEISEEPATSRSPIDSYYGMSRTPLVCVDTWDSDLLGNL